ncbi:HMGL-like protein [Leptotrichia hofstadii F0254]|uniref:2-isopropylmalate synthase n=1 Tax=Leptotrichia hofstadii F0254 TaxID=634994 RepID=C9MXF9_9FUSO|nr:HMGL-like protein [Leptotrichia hofstadii F0254]
MKKHIKIFDTTLRDGEQTPRVNLNTQEKLRIAKQLESLGVDVIEAGFAVASPGDFESVKLIAENIEKSTVTSLARAVKKDIEVAAEAVKNAKKPRIHTFIATSPIHREYKLKMTKEQILDRVKEMVSYAKSLIDDIEFSSEDATRTEKEFLVEVYETAIKAGATTLNVPDTVGYRTPNEMFELITYLKKMLKGLKMWIFLCIAMMIWDFQLQIRLRQFKLEQLRLSVQLMDLEKEQGILRLKRLQ